MVGTVNEDSLESYNREACENALLDALLESLFNSGEEVFGNSAAEYPFFKYKLVRNARLKLNPNITVLTVTAGLLLVTALDFDFLSDSLSVSYLRNGNVNVNAEAVSELADDRIEMNTAESAYYLLQSIRILLVADSLVLLEYPCDSSGYLALVALCLSLDSHLVAALWKFHRRELDNSCSIADSIVCVYVHFQSNNDITAVSLRDICLLLSEQGNELADLVRSARCRIDNSLVRSYLAREHLNERHLADKRICDSLEYESCHRVVFVALYLNELAVGVLADHSVLFRRRRQKQVYFLEKHINACELCAGNAYNRCDSAAVHTLVDTVGKLLLSESFTREELFKQCLVSFGNSL